MRACVQHCGWAGLAGWLLGAPEAGSTAAVPACRELARAARAAVRHSQSVCGLCQPGCWAGQGGFPGRHTHTSTLPITCCLLPRSQSVCQSVSH